MPTRKPKPPTKPAAFGTVRKSKLTAPIAAQILAAIRFAGCWRDTAAARSGVSPYTLDDWIAKGKRQIAEADAALAVTRTLPKLGVYADFYVNLLAAEADLEAEMVGVVLEIARHRGPPTVDEHGNTIPGPLLDPSSALKAATWYLSRKDNLRFGSGSQRTDLFRGGKPDEDGNVDAGEGVIDALNRFIAANTAATGAGTSE